MPRDPTLPEFDRPPVVETVMAVRFRELAEFSSARIGQFWERHLARDFPATEDKAPYAAPVERFGPDGETLELQLRLAETPPPTRAWFLGGNELIQLQSDWFAWNWRKTDDDPDYIRYATGRTRFARWLGELDTYMDSELGKPLVPVQCEVTYVNQVELQTDDDGPFGGSLRHADPAGTGFLPTPEGAQVTWSYLFTPTAAGQGRLHVSATSATDLASGARGVRLVLTGRGRPADDTVDGAVAFCDQAHEWIVQGFKEITTAQMWERWGLRGDADGAD